MKINEALIKGYNILKEAEVDTYQLDSQLLLCHVLKKDKLFLIMSRDNEISLEEEKKYMALIEERKTKKPMAYILNLVEFMGMDFYVEPGVLIPRPDTEILVEECIKLIKENNITKICDMCCGSGAIGVAIAAFEKDTRVWAYDISDIALKVTKKNIHISELNKRIIVDKSDLFEVPAKAALKFEMIVSNPPYIEEEVIPTLMEDVKDFEPHLALSGGKDGLEFYRRICVESTRLLLPKGYLCFEIGYNQEKEVKELLRENGFIDIYSMRDLSGNPRVVIGRLP